jgi:hypothetical protein
MVARGPFQFPELLVPRHRVHIIGDACHKLVPWLRPRANCKSCCPGPRSNHLVGRDLRDNIPKNNRDAHTKSPILQYDSNNV